MSVDGGNPINRIGPVIGPPSVRKVGDSTREQRDHPPEREEAPTDTVEFESEEQAETAAPPEMDEEPGLDITA